MPLDPSEMINYYNHAFSSNLGKLRRNHELSYQKLSELTGIHVSTLTKLEKGEMRRGATIGEVVVIAKAFGVQPAQMLR